MSGHPDRSDLRPWTILVARIADRVEQRRVGRELRNEPAGFHSARRGSYPSCIGSMRSTFTAQLESGNTYAVVCFIQDLPGGPPHAFGHNMFKVFAVG
jgi:hypothetical protein